MEHIIDELQALMAAATTLSDYCARHECDDCIFEGRSEYRPCPFLEDDDPSGWKKWLQHFNPKDL